MRESREARRARAREIIAELERAYPDAKLALNFTTPLELLIATILAAQCTDERVNTVTPALFTRYPDAQALAHARPASLEAQIRSTGFYRAKTRSLLGMARALVERHGGQVPRDLAALRALPGVGLKTANVIIGNAFDGDALPVDTHVFRVAQRLGLGRSDDPDRLHDQLVEVLPQGQLTRSAHLFQAHGRRTCMALRPRCPACPVRRLCPWPDKTGPRESSPRVSQPRAGRPRPARRRAGRP